MVSFSMKLKMKILCRNGFICCFFRTPVSFYFQIMMRYAQLSLSHITIFIIKSLLSSFFVHSVTTLKTSSLIININENHQQKHFFQTSNHFICIAAVFMTKKIVSPPLLALKCCQLRYVWTSNAIQLHFLKSRVIVNE
jgi:hypothetical protein